MSSTLSQPLFVFTPTMCFPSAHSAHSAHFGTPARSRVQIEFYRELLLRHPRLQQVLTKHQLKALFIQLRKLVNHPALIVQLAKTSAETKVRECGCECVGGEELCSRQKYR